MILSVFITVISGHDKPQPPGCLLEIFTGEANASCLVYRRVSLGGIHTITDFTDHMTLICQCQRVNLFLDEVTGFVILISGSNKGVEKSFVCFVQFMAG